MKIQELEDLLEQQRQRAANLEKTKNRLTAELREVTIELENVSNHLDFLNFYIWQQSMYISRAK